MSIAHDGKNLASFDPLPCKAIDDFYTTNGRRSIRRVLEQWLTTQTLTATEFIHSAAALSKFEAAGTSYQHAIQRMAVTLAGRTKQPVTQIMRSLTELTTVGMNRVLADERNGRFPELDTAAILTHAGTLENDPNGLYLLNGILAKHLASAPDWGAKLIRVLALHSEVEPQERAEGGLLTMACEMLIFEIVDDPATLETLLGTEFVQRLFAAGHILKGEPDLAEGVAESLKRLARRFANDELRDVRLALANWLHAECLGTKRLAPGSYSEDLKLFRALTAVLKSVPQAYLHPEQLNEILTVRSRRYVTAEALMQLTTGATAPDEKLDRVLNFEETIFGAANKRALSAYACSLVTARNFESDMSPDYRGFPKLRRLADLQGRILRTDFPHAQRQEMAATLDAHASRIETEGRFLAGLDKRFPDPAERADSYLKLFNADVFTQGMLASKARGALLAAIAEPGFAARYADRKGTTLQAALMDLIKQVKGIGITAEECLKAITPR